MLHAAVLANGKRKTGRKSPVAVAPTGAFKGFWPCGFAFCLLMLAGLTAAAQTTWTVSLLTDTRSVDNTSGHTNYNMPGWVRAISIRMGITTCATPSIRPSPPAARRR